MRSAWVQTLDGSPFDFSRPEDHPVRLATIAHSLAMQCRYNGHCEAFYSVAEHSVLVSIEAKMLAEIGYRDVTPERASILGLLHDAAEAYIGDIVRPVKTEEQSTAEARIALHIFDSLSIGRPTPNERALIELADLRLLQAERAAILKPSLRPWGDWADRIKPSGLRIECWPPSRARLIFRTKAKQLGIVEPRRERSA